MKKQALFFVLVAVFLGTFPRHAATQPFWDVDESTAKQQWLEKLFQSPLSNSGFMYDVKHYGLNLTINPAVNAVSGTVSFFVEVTQNTQSLSFDLRDNMTISHVKWNNQPVSITRQNHVVTVTLSEPTGAGTMGTLEIAYSGTPVTQGFGAWAQTTHNGAGVVWTLSEPYGAYTWWPCKNNLSDKADSVDIIVTTTLGNKVASNGILHSVSEVDNQVIYHWKHRHPIAVYLVAVAVTNYVELTQNVILHNGDTVFIADYCYPESQWEWQTDRQNVVNAIKFFSERFIPYPFRNEKYGHAQFGWGGGMEHQTMSFMYNLGEMLVVHELAHQWFGDYITCGSWSDIWLNESFARYCEGLYIENFYPAQFKSWRMGKVSNITSSPGGSVYVYDTSSVSTIFDGRLVYDKGGMVLHMLRTQIGDSAFFAAINNYLNDPALANGFARTPQLVAHFEQAADTSLSEFFDSWIYKQGYPSYQIVWQYNAPNLYLRVNQTQSHPSVAYFKMKIPVKITRSGRDTTVWLHNLSNNELFVVQPGFEPASVLFDPDYHLITRYNSVTQGQLVSVSDFSKSNVSVFPNPAVNQKINVLSDGIIREIVVYSLTGKEFMRMKPDRNSVEMYLPQGIFLLNITNENCENHIVRVISQ